MAVASRFWSVHPTVVLPVRVELHTPLPLPSSGTVRVVAVTRGTHFHIFHVFLPSSSTVQQGVADNPSLSIRELQVRLSVV